MCIVKKWLPRNVPINAYFDLCPVGERDDSTPFHRLAASVATYLYVVFFTT